MWALENAVFDATHAREVQGPWNVARKAADMADNAISENNSLLLGTGCAYEVPSQLIGVNCMRHALHRFK